MQNNSSLPGLIYDIGAHEGDDTAWYLQLGYQVVAVEANPLLAHQLRTKFADDVKSNRLQVESVAVTGTDVGEVEFHVTEESGEGSIFNQRMNEAGWKYETIRVPSISLSSLFSKFGRGLYCKIDIEGADIPVLLSLHRTDLLPDYFSVELSGMSLNELNGNAAPLFTALDKFIELGYKKFKLVDQYTLATLTSDPFYSKQRNLFVRIAKRLCKATRIYPERLMPRNWYNKKYQHDFTESSSGPFGEMISGEWKTSERMHEIIKDRFREFDQHEKLRHHIFWVDLHAAL